MKHSLESLRYQFVTKFSFDFNPLSNNTDPKSSGDKIVNLKSFLAVVIFPVLFTFLFKHISVMKYYCVFW